MRRRDAYIKDSILKTGLAANIRKNVKVNKRHNKKDQTPPHKLILFFEQTYIICTKKLTQHHGLLATPIRAKVLHTLLHYAAMFYIIETILKTVQAGNIRTNVKINIRHQNNHQTPPQIVTQYATPRPTAWPPGYTQTCSEKPSSKHRGL
jgi:hypothetical protein